MSIGNFAVPSLNNNLVLIKDNKIICPAVAYGAFG